MKPPKRVRVGVHFYSVTSIKRLVNNAGVVGVCGEDTQEVGYDADLGAGVERETVLHELLHGSWHQTVLDKLYTDDQEEQVLWGLTPLILALLRDNPTLVKYLLQVP